MGLEAPGAGTGANPLLSGAPYVWDRLIEEVGPASMLVLIGSRMGDLLRHRLTAEDLWQETLLHAWRDREGFEWTGVAGFRRWLIQIAENRIRDAADRETALRRGGGKAPVRLAGSDGDGISPSLVQSTTPSRVAVHREQATLMRRAIEQLPDDVREVVRLRLFEELEVEEVAGRLGIGVSAVKHRFRKGADTYHRLLSALLTSGSGPCAPQIGTPRK